MVMVHKVSEEKVHLIPSPRPSSDERDCSERCKSCFKALLDTLCCAYSEDQYVPYESVRGNSGREYVGTRSGWKLLDYFKRHFR